MEGHPFQQWKLEKSPYDIKSAGATSQIFVCLYIRHVYHWMFSESIICWESFAARVTTVRFLARVYTHMYVQMIWPSKSFIADTTYKSLVWIRLSLLQKLLVLCRNIHWKQINKHIIISKFTIYKFDTTMFFYSHQRSQRW